MQVSTIGIDLAKNVFQIHGVDAQGNVVVLRQRKHSVSTAGVLLIKQPG